MNQETKALYLKVLQRELIPALGCTEPIAIAYAAAKARSVLGLFPERIALRCSGNIIKNVMGVTVPNSNGLKGVEAAAVLGVVGGNPERELEVLEEITPEQIARTKELISQGYCTCELEEGVENLSIVASVFCGEHFAQVTIINRHTLITQIIRDGEVLFQYSPVTQQGTDIDWSQWSIQGIVDFADHVDIGDVQALLDRQIQMNTAISQAGLTKAYGAQVGRMLLETCGDSAWTRARARAAAGADARMGGCSLPVVINSGSGNQGMTVSLPVLEYAEALGVSPEMCYRALVVSNLVSIYQKHYIGSLSAFCGAVTAASACGAAITYMSGGGYREICRTIANTLGNVSGIVCDGAKASCAAKIASAVDAAIMAHTLSMKGLGFQPGEGIVQEDPEKTIQSIGYIGRVGMKETDVEILNLMLGNVDLDKDKKA